MIIHGAELLDELLAGRVFTLKMVFNATGALVFRANRQHSEMKHAGVSYEDHYKGDALAAVLAPGRIDVRFHRAFDDAHVKRILDDLAAKHGLLGLLGMSASYQGRALGAIGA